jgi:hypothetical protein
VPLDFLFVIELSDEPASNRMLADLAAAVFAYAGLAQGTVDELNAELRQALEDGAGQGRQRCRVRFQAGSGTLTIGVACNGGAEWQAKRRLS